MGAQENNKKTPDKEKLRQEDLWQRKRNGRNKHAKSASNVKNLLDAIPKNTNLATVAEKKEKTFRGKKIHLLKFHKNKIQTKSLFHKREKNHSQLSKENPNYSSVS